MSAIQNVGQKSTVTHLLGSLTDSYRRHVLVILRERTGAMAERELAAQLAAAQQGRSAEKVSAEKTRAVRTSLRHVHLPKLDDVGLVTWNETDETVSITDHAVHDNSQFQQLLVTEDDDWDAIVAALANEQSRIVLAVLESGNGPVARTDLAREVVTREVDGEPSTEIVDRVDIQLHHLHLPELDQAGLVEYDADDGTVTYQGHPKLPRLEF